jgi:hypothetical protein
VSVEPLRHKSGWPSGITCSGRAVGHRLQRLIFFGALSHLVVEVFTVAPTYGTPPTKDERRRLFEEFVSVTRQDFEATLANLPDSPTEGSPS